MLKLYSRLYAIAATAAVFLFPAGLLSFLSVAAQPAGDERDTPLVRAVQKVIPAVVNISTERVVTVSDPFNAFFRDFFDRSPETRYYRETIPLGSGVIIAAEGLVLTNLHVIRRASSVEVRMMDGTAFKAVPIAYNQSNDLALLRLSQGNQNQAQPLDLPVLEFARPDDLRLAETVMAVGNPFGLEGSVSSGVLSARNRNWREGGVEFNDILQTDAAINPGNSGGPLVNLEGRMIGINLAIRAGAEGIGFAIPVRRIEQVLASWLVPDYFSLGTVGFIPVNQVGQDGAWQVVAEQLVVDGPAAQAGLRDGDLITAINGHPVSRSLEVSQQLWQLRPGDRLTLARKDHSVVAFEVGEMSADQLLARRLGLQLQELSESLKLSLQIPEPVTGLVVSDVLANGAAENLDIRRGDIVYGLGRVQVNSKREVVELLDNFEPGTILEMQVMILRHFRERPILQRRNVRLRLQ